MTVTTIANAAAAYANAGKGTPLGPSASGGGASFGDLLKQAVDGAVGSIKEGETMSLKAVTGQADITEVVTAMTNAETTLQTVTAVRDRVISAYQDILRMPI